jgi:hypothetical protein
VGLTILHRKKNTFITIVTEEPSDLDGFSVEVEWGDVDWIGLAQDRDKGRALVNSVLNLRVP